MEYNWCKFPHAHDTTPHTIISPEDAKNQENFSPVTHFPPPFIKKIVMYNEMEKCYNADIK